MAKAEIEHRHTPAFVREFCTQKFMLFTSVLDEIILGGLKLEPEAVKALKERGQVVDETQAMAVATITERLKAIEMYGKFGPGIRTDHRAEDGPPRRSVVAMPPWEDEEEGEFEDVTDQAPKELPSGNGKRNGDQPQAG